MGRHDDPLHVQQVERRGEEHRPGRAVGDEAEVARVDTVADGDVGHLLGDVRRRDPVRERDPLLERQRRVERLERLPGEIGVEPQRAAREAVGIEDAHQQAGIGQRRRGAAAAVAGRARVGAGAGRPDEHVARRRDRDDAAAAGPDAAHLGREGVDDEVVLELERVADDRAAVAHERDVGRRAADVAADQLGFAERLSQARARDRPCGRPGEDDPERLLERLLPGKQRRGAVGEVELTREAQPAQLAVELGRVVGVDRAS